MALFWDTLGQAGTHGTWDQAATRGLDTVKIMLNIRILYDIWVLYGYYMSIIWVLYGYYMGIIWLLYGYYMVNMNGQY